jgi:thymidylate synthase (FAD)
MNETELVSINHGNYTDPLMVASVLSYTPKPQTSMYLALHQDYSDFPVWNEAFVPQDFQDFTGKLIEHATDIPSEKRCGEIAVKRLLAKKRGHWGPMEHVCMALLLKYIPRSAMVQMRTHRNVSFDVMSGRYCCDAICLLATAYQTSDWDYVNENFDKVFYLRPVGKYRDRKGHTYHYTESNRDADKLHCLRCALVYKGKIDAGFSEEHARDVLPSSALRIHMVLSGNLRSLLHLIDVRQKKDVQLECYHPLALLHDRLKWWCPQIMEWYDDNRLGKAELAP